MVVRVRVLGFSGVSGYLLFCTMVFVVTSRWSYRFGVLVRVCLSCMSPCGCFLS